LLLVVSGGSTAVLMDRLLFDSGNILRHAFLFDDVRKEDIR
jgi:hypothetical protein